MPKLDEKRETEGKAEYIMFDHEDGEAYFGFQILLKGILDVYYDKTRGNSRNLGFTAFEPGRGYDRKLGEIPYIKEHGDRAM